MGALNDPVLKPEIRSTDYLPQRPHCRTRSSLLNQPSFMKLSGERPTKRPTTFADMVAKTAKDDEDRFEMSREDKKRQKQQKRKDWQKPVIGKKMDDGLKSDLKYCDIFVFRIHIDLFLRIMSSEKTLK